MDQPLVSIIIPNYNSEKVLQETLDSVFNQTYKNWEIIFVDDCSTDNSYNLAIKNAREDSRIRTYKVEKNSGPGYATKYGFDKARGEWLAFIDADDLWLPTKLEKQLKFSLENNYDFTCTNYEKIDESSKPLNIIVKTFKKTNYRNELLFNPLGCSAVMIKSSLFSKIEVPLIRAARDYCLWLQILKVYPYAYGLQEVLMQYRVWPQSISYNKFKKVKFHWSVYRDYEKKSVFVSVLLVIWWGIIKTLKVKERKKK